MLRKSGKHITLSVLVALLLPATAAHAVKNFKISGYGGGHQIWFEAEEFDERNPDDEVLIVGWVVDGRRIHGDRGGVDSEVSSHSVASSRRDWHKSGRSNPACLGVVPSERTGLSGNGSGVLSPTEEVGRVVSGVVCPGLYFNIISGAAVVVEQLAFNGAVCVVGLQNLRRIRPD